jgi:hypothetical protein
VLLSVSYETAQHLQPLFLASCFDWYYYTLEQGRNLANGPIHTSENYLGRLFCDVRPARPSPQTSFSAMGSRLEDLHATEPIHVSENYLGCLFCEVRPTCPPSRTSFSAVGSWLDGLHTTEPKYLAIDFSRIVCFRLPMDFSRRMLPQSFLSLRATSSRCLLAASS